VIYPSKIDEPKFSNQISFYSEASFNIKVKVQLSPCFF